ncbi:hypothetical protein GOODEAATRI_003943 [Goodea atripinnis]|uniref:AH domain-containing protein n=1 Tax=Goodea atripinnis TaxID=208336 RepID=A0ABV0MYH3_9TELE
MSSGTADALGLSRAILCNDGLVKRLEELEKTAELYKGFGDVFSIIGVREPQAAASEAFVKFADAHRNIEKYGIQLLKTIKPMLHDLNTYLHKAIPDTKLTIRKYLDVKFEYLVRTRHRVFLLSYTTQLIIISVRSAGWVCCNFSCFSVILPEGMSHYYDDCYAVLKEADVFPIEVDLSRTMLNYSSQSLSCTDEDEEDGGGGEEGGSTQAENGTEKLIDDE